MYLKALQRPRRVPERCRNEGFFHTTANLVASLHVKPDHFLILCAFAPFALCRSVSLALSLSFSLGLSSPSPFLPSDFLSLIPSLFQLSWEMRFSLLLGCSQGYHSSSSLSLTVIYPFSVYAVCFLRVSQRYKDPLNQSSYVWKLQRFFFLVSLNCPTSVKPSSDISGLSRLSLIFQWRPCPPTLSHPSTSKGFCLTLYEGNMSWPVIHSSTVQFRWKRRKGGSSFYLV